MDSKTNDKTPIMRALLMAAVAGLLLFPTVATVNAAETDTVTRYWDGKAFTETKDPLKRFVEFPLTDNGNGFANIAPIPTPSGAPRVGQNTATNLEIEAGMLILGITKSQVIQQLGMVLGGSPAFDDARATAENAIMEGDYLSANLALAGTPAEVSFYCGDSASIPWEFHWYFGVPYRADCDANGSQDQLMVLIPTRAAPVTSGAIGYVALYSADLTFLTNPLSAAQPVNEWLGFGYSEISVGAITVSQNHVKITLSVSSIPAPGYGGSPWGTINWGVTSGFYFPGDKFFVAVGASPGYDSTIYIVTDTTITSWGTYLEIGWAVYSGALNGLTVYASMDTTTGIRRIDVHVPVSGKMLDIQASNVPQSFRFRYDRSDPIWTDNNPAHRTYKYLLQLDSAYSLYNFELKGTLRDHEGVMASLQFLGFPKHTELVIDPGWSSDSCADTNSVFAMDLTKGYSSGNSGWFRSFVVDGNTCDKNVKIVGTDIERGRLVTGRHDIWSDNDQFIILAATAYPFDDSAFKMDSGPRWIRDYHGEIDDSGPTNGFWILKNPACSPTPCSGLLPHGSWTIGNVLWAFNGYFWVIGPDQLDRNFCRPEGMTYLYGDCP